MNRKIQIGATLGISMVAGALLLFGLDSTVRADVQLSPLFTNNMVLQRDKPLPVWGTANASENVTVDIGPQEKKTVTGADGSWRVVFNPLSMMRTVSFKVSGQNTLELSNVAVGDIYLCSGQSNMEFGMGMLANADQEIAAANYPNIRLMLVPHQISSTPQKTFSGPLNWKVCTPQTVAQGGWNGFSAVAYFFGRDLNQKLNIPIGLIESSWGGTVAQAWTSSDTLLKRDDLRDQTLMAKTTNNPNQPTVLYNGMIAPLEPFALKGAIWYQGEANADNPAQYRTLFPALIGDWREHWAAKTDGSDFPFYFVQLASFMGRTGAPVEKGWAELRDAQSNSLTVAPNTGMASAIDIGDGGDIHPKNKADVGKRLALNALAKTYRQSVEYSGPTFQALKLNGPNARVQLSHAQGLRTKDGAAPLSFAVQDANGKWFPANAHLNNGTVVLSNPEVAAPQAVRYAWANNPTVNLVNAAGLPANPFRTDTSDLGMPIIAVMGAPVAVEPDNVDRSGPYAAKNLALGKAYTSSDPNAHNYGIGALTDGSWNTDGQAFATNDGPTFPKTATIDLGKTAMIGQVLLGVPSYGSTETITVAVSTDGKAFKDVGSTVFSQNKSERHLFNFAPVDARYVRLTYPDHYDKEAGYPANFVFTSEVEVYPGGTLAQ